MSSIQSPCGVSCTPLRVKCSNPRYGIIDLTVIESGQVFTTDSYTVVKYLLTSEDVDDDDSDYLDDCEIDMAIQRLEYGEEEPEIEVHFVGKNYKTAKKNEYLPLLDRDLDLELVLSTGMCSRHGRLDTIVKISNEEDRKEFLFLSPIEGRESHPILLSKISMSTIPRYMNIVDEDGDYIIPPYLIDEDSSIVGNYRSPLMLYGDKVLIGHKGYELMSDEFIAYAERAKYILPIPKKHTILKKPVAE